MENPKYFRFSDEFIPPCPSPLHLALAHALEHVTLPVPLMIVSFWTATRGIRREIAPQVLVVNR